MDYKVSDIKDYCIYPLAESEREISPFTELCEKIWEAVCLFFAEAYSHFFGLSIQSESLLKEVVQIESVAKEAKELNYPRRSISSYVHLHFQTLALQNQEEKEALEERESLFIRKVGNEALVDVIVKNLINNLKKISKKSWENPTLHDKEIIRAMKKEMENQAQEIIPEIQKTTHFAYQQFGIDGNALKKAEISFQFENLLSSLKLNERNYKANTYKIYRQAGEKILEKAKAEDRAIAEESLNECYKNLGIADDIQKCLTIQSDYKQSLLTIEKTSKGRTKKRKITDLTILLSQSKNLLEQQVIFYEIGTRSRKMMVTSRKGDSSTEQIFGNIPLLIPRSAESSTFGPAATSPNRFSLLPFPIKERYSSLGAKTKFTSIGLGLDSSKVEKLNQSWYNSFLKDQNYGLTTLFKEQINEF